MKRNLLCVAACWLLAVAPSGLHSADTAATMFNDGETKLCTLLALKNQPWASPRWEVSLTEARARAAKENKPVFLVVNTGNVLGFV